MNAGKPGLSMNGTRVVNNGSRPRQPNTEKDYNCCRIVLLGQAGVGKTALTVRFMTKRFIGEYCPTLEGIHKKRTFVDNEEVKMEILDTAGHTSASSWPWRDYYAFWGDCYLYVYSVNDRNSFDAIIQIKRHVENVRKNNACGILVGNKSDLLHDRQVPEDEAMELADEIGCRFFEVSAADWTHMDLVAELFYNAVREFRKTRTARDLRSRRPSSSVRFRQAIQKVITGKVTNKRVSTS